MPANGLGDQRDQKQRANRHFIKENSLQWHLPGTKFERGLQGECVLGDGWRQRRS